MHRIRLLLAAAAGVLVSFVGLAHPASAQESTNYKDSTTEECAKLLAEGQSVDDCQKAPNPLVPAKNELIWGFVGLALVFAFLTWKALPAMKAGMNARTERIQGDLDAAEAQRTEAS